MNIISRMRANLLSESGVAMITVILVGAVLTVVTTTASVVTIQDFRSGADDRRATEALGYAESGVDRVMLELRGGGYGWKRLNEAGCAAAPIVVPEGDLGANRRYEAYLTVFDANLDPADRLPPLGAWQPGDPWDGSADSSAVCQSHDDPPPTEPMLFAIISNGEHPTASRLVRQVIQMEARGLPIGLYADSVLVQGGNPTALSISLVTPGNVDGREKLDFSGYDPYYKLGHFWEGQSTTQAAPAAVHARGVINCAKNRPVEPFTEACGDDSQEHPGPLNCTANRSNNGQSQWDQSGWTDDPNAASLSGFAKCPTWSGSPSGPPPYSNMTDADLARARPTPTLSEEDYAMLKQAAQDHGLYCAMTGDTANNGTCKTPSGTFDTKGTIQSVSGVGKVFVAFFDYPSSGDAFASSRTITWKAGIGPCSSDQAVNRNVVIVVRYGGLDLSGKDELVGAFLAPDGQIWMRGSGGIVKIHGTAIAERLNIGGDAEIKLSECWINNMPNIFLNVRPLSWSEVDR